MLAAALGTGSAAAQNACPAVSADREYLQTLITEQDKRNEVRFRSYDTALALARDASHQEYVDNRTYLNNLIQGATNYVPRSENKDAWEGIQRQLTELSARQTDNLKEANSKLSAIDLRITSYAGRSEGISGSLSVIISVVSLLVAAVAIWFHRPTRPR